jgi:hypothetical protein
MGKTASLANIGSIADSSLGFRNRIQNGAMVIDQRNAGASVAFASNTSGYSLDRWLVDNTTDGALTVQQSSTAPAGFASSCLITVTTADASLAATQRCRIRQPIEGYNISDLAWGTASAQAVTLSFWVRSSLTGTFGGALNNSAADRSYPFTYTISAANTWEQKTVTVAGDTSGTWLTTNGIGLIVQFGLGIGSTFSGTAGAWAGSQIMAPTGATSVVGTSGATFYITGVQLEKGATATAFDYRPYGTELALCQRYYWRATNEGDLTTFGVGAISTVNNLNRAFTAFPVKMRAKPTFGFTNLRIYDGVNVQTATTSTDNWSTTNVGSYQISSSGGTLTAGRVGLLIENSTALAYVDFSAEL